MPTLDFAGNPLVSDERTRTIPRQLDFSGNPVGLDVSRAPGAAPTLQGMPQMDMGGFQEQLQSRIRSPLTVAPDAPNEAMIYYSPSTGDLVVNGFQFNQRNASQALVSRQWAAQPRQQFTLPDTATDWRAMAPEEYASYMDSIENPGFGRRMGEAWEHAWRGMGDVGVGAILAGDRALTGDEDNQWALNARASLTREFEENAPFMMQLRDVENVEDGLTYFAQMLVQGAPWLAETAVSMAVGGLIGGAVSGGVGAPAGAIEAFIAKEGLRAASRQLLRNNLARGARIFTEAQAERGAGALLRTSASLSREDVLAYAARTGGSADDVNRFFNFGERAYHMSRTSAGGSGFAQAGQVGGMGASNYMTGVGDIRNAIADAGGDTESADAVANIWGLAIPYAFVESMGDLLLTQPVSRLLPGLANGASRIGNAGRGALMVGAAEGLEEGSQYVITQQGVAGATDTPIDIEPMDLLESVVGGAIAGAGLGGVVGAIGTPNRRPPVTPPPSATITGDPTITPSGPFFGPDSTASARSGGTGYSGASMGGFDPDYDPNDDNPNYVGIQEEQAMRTNALDRSWPTSYDGEGDIGGLDLNQDPNDIDPNYVGQQEAQAMRTNAISDIGPTTVTPPPANTQAQRTPEDIFRDLARSRPIAPQEFQILRDAVRREQMADPTNPVYTETINYINDAEAEQNTVEPKFDWTQPELLPVDGLPASGPHRLQSYRDAKGNPTGRAAPEYVEPVAPPNTDKLGVTRDHMGRTKGITASMENVQGAQARRDYAERPRLTPVQKKNKKRKLKAREDAQPRGGFSKANATAQQVHELENRDVRGGGRDNRQAEEIFADAKGTNPERAKVVDKFGGESHNAWLKNFRKQNPKGAKKPRMRERGGAMVDINQPWDKLDERAKADNALAAEAAYNAYKAHPDDIEAGSAMIHAAWVERNKNDKSIDKALLEPYDKLSEEEKEKDRVHWRRVRDILNPSKPKRNRLQEAGDRIKEAKNAIPERSTETVSKAKQPRPVQEDASRDSTGDSAASKGTDTAGTESVQSTEVNQARVDKAIAALEYIAKRDGRDNMWVKQHAASLASNLKQSEKKPRNISHDKYAWYFNNGLNRADLKVVIDHFKSLVEKKEPKARVSANVKRAQAFHSQVMEEWSRAKDAPQAFVDFVTDPKYREEVENWVNNEISKLAVKVRNTAKEILDTTQNPKRAMGGKGGTKPGSTIMTAILRRALIEDPNFRLRPFHPASLARAQKIVDEIHAAQKAAGVAESSLKAMQDSLQHIKESMREKPKRATGERLPRKVIDVRTPDGPSQIYVNPTRDDVMKLTRTPFGQDKSKYNTVRFILDDNRNLFVANGYFFIHDQIVDVVEERGITVAGYESDLGNVQMGHGDEVVASSFERKGSELVFSKFSSVTEATLWPKRSTGSGEATQHKVISESEARKVVGKVQRLIAEDVQFKTTHVLGNVLDIFERGNEEMMIAPNGAKVSLMSYIMRQTAIMKLENPELKALSDETAAAFYIQTHMQSKAFVVPGYNALFVFADYMKNNRDFIEVLEHEYIVHGGLKAIFPNRIERELFLRRFANVPGVEQMRMHLLSVKPEYGNNTYLDQLEEVLAYHSMHGPLALERLLSAEEGIDQATRRTLWQDLKRMAADWIAKVFGTEQNKTADVMDDIIAALREHSIVGSTGDVMSIMDKHGIPEVTAEEREAFYSSVNEKVKRAVGDATATPAETQEKLFDTKNNPMRPYRPKGYVSDTIEMLRANEPLIDKLEELRGRNVATPIKEALKKVGQELVTMNDMALKSVLIEKMMRIMHNTIKYARNIMTRIQEQRQYMSKSAKSARLRALWGDTFPGSTKEQLDAANHMMLIATNNRIATLSDTEVRNAARLRVRNLDGTYTLNTAVYAEMLKRGTLSKEEFLKGVEQFTVDKNGELTSAGVANLPKEVIELGYEIYANESKLMAESALKTLEAMNEALSMRNENSIEQLLRDLDLKEKDQPFVREALLRMRKLYADIAFHKYSESGHTKRYSQQEMGYNVMVELQRAFHEELKVADWTDSRTVRKEGAPRAKNDAFKWREQTEPHKDVEPFVDQIRWFLEYDDTLGQNRMEHINSVGVNKDQQYDIMNVFQSLINAETQAYELENDVIQSVMGNYVEMTRNGEWRVALEVRDENGKEYTDINPQVLAALPVTYAESKREAIKLQEEWMEEFTGKHTINNMEGKPVKITFDVSMAQAPGTKTMGDAPKVREFLKVAELAGMTLKPHQMKVIANLIESASTRKRLGLQRAGTPGADINVLHNNSQTMTRRAWQAAKTSQAWMLESTMTDRKNQYGDWDHLAMLQRNFDVANRGAPINEASPVTFIRKKAAVVIAEQELLRYAEQLRHMARHTLGRPTVNVRTTKGEQKLKITGGAEAYTVHAQALKASLEKGVIEVNLNDMLSKTGALRQMAVVSQLGTIASGLMNALTPLTHLPWRLAAKHDKTGYGEGFNLTEISAEIISAVSQIGTVFKNLADSAAIKKILDDAKAGNNSTGLTLPELEALYEETLNGVLMPQQTYSLTGGTESNITNLLARNLMTTFLGPFSAFEASTRRVSFLTAYRLMKRRYIAAGVSEASLEDSKSPEYKKLMEDIERVVFDTQGDYSNINRPRSFRGDWMQYILQYKMFPLNTVLLIKNMPHKEQAMMLGVLFLLSGLKGQPFADDFADIYDTLLQKLGFRHDSVELQLTRALENIMPGLSTWVMHGGVDNFIPIGATISSRVSMGDILPLTGLGRPEADVGRELTNALGPAFAANWDMVEWAGTLTDFVFQVTGAKPRTMSYETMAVEFFHQLPQGQVRAVTEAGMMLHSGQITDPRGRLVSDEVNPINIFSRALSFYPLEASRANTAVRLDRMHTGYMKAIRANFILAYANAYRQNNQDEMERINDVVQDWNDAVERTGQEDMEISNFRTAAIRAGRAASSTTIERTSEGAPDYSLIDELAGILNADQESDDE